MQAMEWNNLKDTQPEDGQRVLTWNIGFKEARIQIYNEYYQCWDTEDGDDREWELHVAPYWMPLPEFDEEVILKAQKVQ